MSKNYTPTTPLEPFFWDDQRGNAAIALAHGKTKQEVADEVGCVKKTLYNWLAHPEFSEEVDRLSLMVGIASKAERLRLAQRVIRNKCRSGIPETKADLLDWVKFAQSDTSGIKLEMVSAALASIDEQNTPPPTPPSEPELSSEQVS